MNAQPHGFRRHVRSGNREFSFAQRVGLPGVLDDPVQGVVWLARRLARHGVTLAAGETILAGSFTRPVDCRAGDGFEVDFGDLGVIRLAFS